MLRTIVHVYLGGGFIYSVKGYDQERYGSNPRWSLAVGTGLSLSSKTFLIAKVGYLFHHEFKNGSTVPSTVEYSWEHLLVSIGVMYKIPVRDYFDINIDAGVSWLGFFGNNYLGDLVKPNDSFLPEFVGFGLERPLGNKEWSIFAEMDYETLAIRSSSKSFNGFSTIGGIKYYFGR